VYERQAGTHKKKEMQFGKLVYNFKRSSNSSTKIFISYSKFQLEMEISVPVLV